MANTAVLAVRIISDASKAAQGLDQTATKTSKLSKAGSIAGKALAVGFGAAAFGMVKATKAAAEDAEAQTKLHNIMRQAAGATAPQIAATEKWITAQGKAKGVADDELRPALGRLISVTHDVGKSQRLASLAMDISAGTGKSLETVSTALAKAQAGSVGGLSRLGVATKTASGETKSLQAITKDLTKTYSGAAAKSADTAAGKQRILSVQMGELQEQIGAKLLPVMLKLTDVGLKVVDWISKNTTTVGVFIGTLASLLAIVKLVSVATQVCTAVSKVWTAVTIVARNAQLAWNLAMMANPIGLVIAAIVALVAVIVLAWKKSETFRKIVIGAWNAIKAATSKVWGAIKAVLSAVWRFIVGAVKAYVSTYKKVVVAVWNAIKTATSKVWNGIKTVLKAVWSFIVGVVRGNINRARAIITAVWTVIKSATGRAWDAVKRVVSDAIGRVVAFVVGLKNRVTNVFRNAGSWLLNAGKKIIQGLIDGIRNMFDNVRGALGDLTSKLTSWKGPPSRDAKLLTRNGELLIEGLIVGVRNRHGKLKAAMAEVTGIVAGTPLAATTGTTGGTSLRGGGVVVIHEHYTINGATDPVGTGRQIEQLQKRRDRRLGKRG